MAIFSPLIAMHKEQTWLIDQGRMVSILMFNYMRHCNFESRMTAVDGSNSLHWFTTACLSHCLFQVSRSWSQRLWMIGHDMSVFQSWLLKNWRLQKLKIMQTPVHLYLAASFLGQNATHQGHEDEKWGWVHTAPLVSVVMSAMYLYQADLVSK